MKKFVIAIAMSTVAGAALAEDLGICVEGAFPPFSETTSDGSVQGFDVDIANALCDEMGKSCEMVTVDWDGIIPALLEQKCDAIVASMSITPDRQEVIDFTNKYYQTPNQFVAEEGTDFEAIGEGRVGVQRGTVSHDFMETHYPDTDLVLYATTDEAFLDLNSGRIDAVFNDSIATQDGFLDTEAGEGYALIGPDLTDAEVHGEGIGIGVRKDDDALTEDLNAAIATIRENGTYAEINDKYFDIDIYGAE